MRFGMKGKDEKEISCIVSCFHAALYSKRAQSCEDLEILLDRESPLRSLTIRVDRLFLVEIIGDNFFDFVRYHRVRTNIKINHELC